MSAFALLGFGIIAAAIGGAIFGFIKYWIIPAIKLIFKR
jgi:hypothetical protein